LPDVPVDASFFLCGKGTFLNINGYPDIVCTEELNAIMSVTDHWEIAVEIPIEVNPEVIGISQTINSGVLDSAPSQDAVFNALNQYLNSVGSFHYADLATQTTPQAVAANVDEKLLNDGLGTYTNVSNAPYGVSSTYNSTTNQLDFSQLSIGDLINFRIAIVDPRNPTNQTTLQFRAYIDDFSDSYGASWKEQSYMGRGEKFYKYDGFSRDLSLGFTIVADSKTQLGKMYEQLNTLAASLAPTYTSQGYMTGNLHRLTVGNYISGQWGVMTGLQYTVSEDSPWEIDENEQLPHYIKVSGIKFNVIHNFRPEYNWDGNNKYILQNAATNNS